MIACTSNPLSKKTHLLPVYGNAAEWICLITEEHSAQPKNLHTVRYRKDISASLLDKSVPKARNRAYSTLGTTLYSCTFWHDQALETRHDLFSDCSLALCQFACACPTPPAYFSVALCITCEIVYKTVSAILHVVVFSLSLREVLLQITLNQAKCLHFLLLSAITNQLIQKPTSLMLSRPIIKAHRSLKRSLPQTKQQAPYFKTRSGFVFFANSQKRKRCACST